jgi:hypothetical protein
MEEEVRDAVFGNVGTMITFRVGAFDAEVLEKEFAPTFMATDLVNLGFAQIYLKLMIDGVSSQPFSATTLPGIARPEFTFKDQVLESSREQFARKREDVEKGISDWHDSTTIKDSQKNNSNGGNNIERRENKIVREDRPMPEVKKSLPPVADDIKVPDENKIALMKAAEELKKRQSQIENVQAENKPKLSLDDLRKEKELSMQVGKKNPSKENLSSLKDALAGVLNKKTEEKINSEKEVSKDYVVKNESKPTDTVSTPPKKVTEVPENVLREILKMDDGK